jgi:hypothetical protein
MGEERKKMLMLLPIDVLFRFIGRLGAFAAVVGLVAV